MDKLEKWVQLKQDIRKMQQRIAIARCVEEIRKYHEWRRAIKSQGGEHEQRGIEEA